MTTPSDPTPAGDPGSDPSNPTTPPPPGPAPYGAPPPGAPQYGTPSQETPGYATPPQYGGSQYGGSPYGSAPYGAAPYGPSAAQPSKTMAIWALVLGWIPCAIGFVVSVVLAIIVLGRSRDGRNHGKGMAIGGLVGVAFYIVLIVVVFAVRPFAAHRDASGHLTRGGVVTIDGLRVGDCGTKQLTGITRTVHVVPCSQAHVFEVLVTFEMPDGPYPGDDQVKRLAVGGCVKRTSKLPALKGRSDLRLTYLHPISSTWVTQKTVVCMANTDRPTTGSLTGGS
jgi:hypothetical protein